MKHHSQGFVLVKSRCCLPYHFTNTQLKHKCSWIDVIFFFPWENSDTLIKLIPLVTSKTPSMFSKLVSNCPSARAFGFDVTRSHWKQREAGSNETAPSRKHNGIVSLVAAASWWGHSSPRLCKEPSEDESLSLQGRKADYAVFPG